ncbi:MAG: tetratricopeptide repeat protein [Bacteroidia bacterium]|nr:tetratricopeptide repeat protein [Bacteroidia bacterium]
MKKLHLVILILAATCGYTFSQTCSSCRVSSFNYLKYSELDKAKETSDFCITCDKSKVDPRVWYYRGMIYQNIHTSKDYKKLDAEAADKAFEAYKSALVFNFVDPNLQKLDIINNQADQMKFFTALNDQKTKYVDSEMLMDILMNQYPALANIFVNKGVEEYQTNKNYEKAYKYFENSLFVSGMSMKIDTPVIYYCALAAQKAKKYEEAKQMFDVLIKLGYGANDKERVGNYFFLADIHKNNGDTTKYISTLKKGIEKYPKESTPLVVELINYYLSFNDVKTFDVSFTDGSGAIAKESATNIWEKTIDVKKGQIITVTANLKIGNQITIEFFSNSKSVKKAEATGANGSATCTYTATDKDKKVTYKINSTPEYVNKTSEAINYLDLAIKNSPDNPTYWFAQGSLYDANLKDTLKAVTSYKKAIELNPNYFEPNYNMGAMYYNQGAEMLNTANNITDDKLYKAAKAKAEDKLKESLPYLEKAHEILPADLSTMESLKNTYYRLSMLEKMEAIKKELAGAKK